MKITIEADTRENAAHAAWWVDRELTGLNLRGVPPRNWAIRLPDGSEVTAQELEVPEVDTSSLTHAKRRIVHAILHLTHREGYAPTVSEICDAVYLTRATVHRHISDLRALGWLEGGESSRTLRVVPQGA